MRASYRFASFILIVTVLLSWALLSDAQRRVPKMKCKTGTNCKEFCIEKRNKPNSIPRCYQHRCFCTTPDAPLNRPLSGYEIDLERSGGRPTPDPETLPDEDDTVSVSPISFFSRFPVFQWIAFILPSCED